MQAHSIAHIFSRKKAHESPPPLEVSTLENLGEYQEYVQSMASETANRRDAEFTLAGHSKKIRSRGFCHVCARNSVFKTNFMYSDPAHVYKGEPMPNWREQAVCRRCRLNGRVRSAIHFLEEKLEAEPDHTIYATEQFTPLYHCLRKKYSYLFGSEYLGNRVPFGKTDPDTGVRNESLGKLTFPDNFFDFILCFDVLEHVPDYLQGFRECLRCLTNTGTLLFSVPFCMDSEQNLVRARIDESGNIQHILPPEYHGDPVSSEGCLCFYHFGWELMAELRETGFENVTANLLWSDRLAYLGNNQVLFTAQKPVNNSPRRAPGH
ncbi:MAG: methyltransferase domain-containing protein [Xanthomonadales bacterium]|jgi:SAM-dependent methyltransferase|nr:methyltransferase domain-containing protein [Xanthomonadales bacterium]